MTESNREKRNETEQRRFRASLVRRAIAENAPLLAPLLDRHARAEGLTWREMADDLGCTLDQLHHVACCLPPREESFAEDVETIASAGGVEPDRLLSLLRRIHVTAALAEAPTILECDNPPNYLLAARDVDEEGEQ